jgi:hypothetical protein
LVQSSCSLRAFGPFRVEHDPIVDGVGVGFVDGPPQVRFSTRVGIVGSGSMTERPPSPGVARRRVALKDASRRFAMAKRPPCPPPAALRQGQQVGTEGWSFRSNIGIGERASIQFPYTSRCPFKLFEGDPSLVTDAADGELENISVLAPLLGWTSHIRHENDGFLRKRRGVGSLGRLRFGFAVVLGFCIALRNGSQWSRPTMRSAMGGGDCRYA